MAAKKKRRGATFYVLGDPAAGADGRMMKAVRGEGMPTHKNPFVFGNLFLVRAPHPHKCYFNLP